MPLTAPGALRLRTHIKLYVRVLAPLLAATARTVTLGCASVAMIIHRP
jgi:hypothetical protein